jgi:hypothetical protein
LITISSLLKDTVENNTLSLGPNEFAQETLVVNEDIVDEAYPCDFLELEEEITDATNELLADYEYSKAQVESNWDIRTSLILDSSQDALSKRTLGGYKR